MSKFAAAVNCMDGRVQMPVIEYIKNKYGVDYVDMITLPGPNKVLAERKDEPTLESIKRCIEISVNLHGSRLVAISGHFDCAGNPADKEIQMSHILAAIDTVRSWQFEVCISGLWVDENWIVNLIP